MKSSNGLAFVRYSPHTSDHQLTLQVVECYRDVFAEVPWNEWYRCQNPVCERHEIAPWGKRDAEELKSLGFSHCGLSVVDFWPQDQVLSDLFHEITPDSSAWVAVDDDRVVGFCWGYPISVSSLKEKLKIQFRTNGIGDDDLVAYQDDVGVLSSHRNRKIAKSLIAHRHDDFVTSGLTLGVVRTRQFPEPSVTFTWYTEKLGYDIVAKYPDKDGRVILARQFEGLKELLS